MGNCTGGSNPPLSATPIASRSPAAGFFVFNRPSQARLSDGRLKTKNDMSAAHIEAIGVAGSSPGSQPSEARL
ncbi:MAG TPA: hypothetical protein VK207_03685 [Bacteroidales bacterium]|nr:hypothetical protein [Bacteroidales bacterium]